MGKFERVVKLTEGLQYRGITPSLPSELESLKSAASAAMDVGTLREHPFLGETLCKGKHKVNSEEKEKHLRSYQPGGTLRETISITTTPRKDYQQEENYYRYFQTGDLVQKSNQQNRSVLKKKETDKNEFEILEFKLIRDFLKMNFTSGVSSSSSFPTESMNGTDQ